MKHYLPLRTRLLSFFYKNILKNIFFHFDPERVHDRITFIGRALGGMAFTRWCTSVLFNFADPRLEQTVAGIRFKNPIGLAAGFDKDAQLTDILPSVGFGFAEVGSITGEPCAGNPKPRLWRLKESQSLLVYYGLKNSGCVAIARRLKHKRFRFPVGISVAKTNSPYTVSEADGIRDYFKAYGTFVELGIGDYYTVNISCPNAFGGEPFTEPGKLDRLLEALRTIPGKKPIFLKMPAEIKEAELEQILPIARKHKITGFICGNLGKNRNNPLLKDENVPATGGMSGRVMRDISDNLVASLYRRAGSEFVIIGCGGVFTAEDAYRKIKLGASLIQLIGGMIYEGPQMIGAINRGLVELLKRDGYTTITEAIGTAHR